MKQQVRFIDEFSFEMRFNFKVQRDLSCGNFELNMLTFYGSSNELLLSINTVFQWLICSTFMDQFEFEPLVLMVFYFEIGL